MGPVEKHVNQTEVDIEAQVDISKHFDGEKHYSLAKGKSYTNPRLGHDDTTATSSLFRHRDVLHRVTYKPRDVQRYISPTYGKPYRQVVQATEEASKVSSGAWRRRKISGNAPWLLRLSSWVLEADTEEGDGRGANVAVMIGKCLLVVPAQFCLLWFPTSTGTWTGPFYKPLPAHSFEYPIHARNELDAGPSGLTKNVGFDRRLQEAKQHGRMLSPRRLVVWGEEGWRVDTNTTGVPYIFVSYTRSHWDPAYPDSLPPLHKLARHLARTAGLRAYWLDHQCIPQTGDATEDIHQICDVVRGASQVCVAVPTLDMDVIAAWGSRMWTMPEVLICQNNVIKFCAPDKSTIERTRISLAEEIWGGDQSGRLLAEHFSGSLTLSRLELIQVALKALSARDTKAMYSNGDLAYALQGLLNRRPKANMQDTQFQALARLSLANDSDGIVERMMCMLPPVEAANDGTNRKFVLEDDLYANLWDIEPLCQVAGVCEGSTVMLDGCRGASIRWKDIPTINYAKKDSWKRLAAAVSLRSGGFWLIIGAALCGSPATIGGGIFLLILGLILIFSSPWSVMMLYGGKVWGATPWLIGIEGTLSLAKIERLAFGNAIGRLRWAPSSSLLARKLHDERLGDEPDWIRGNGPHPQLPPNQRLFTLIDTGSMTCHLFTAERPPSAAVIAGKEGGMLRVVLCSYERSNGTLIKETVLRMETPMLDKTGLLGWIKMA